MTGLIRRGGVSRDDTVLGFMEEFIRDDDDGYGDGNGDDALFNLPSALELPDAVLDRDLGEEENFPNRNPRIEA